MFGIVNDQTMTRSNFDTLDYYYKDISWFTMIFVLVVLHFQVILMDIHYLKYQPSVVLKFAFSIIMFFSRLAQCYFFMPYRDENRVQRLIDSRTLTVFGVI